MGCDSEAMLFYGFCLGTYEDDNGDEVREISENWEERYFATIGIPKPPYPIDWEKKDNADVLAWVEYWRLKQENKPPFDVKIYGSEPALGWAVVVNESLISVEWSEVAHPVIKDFSYADEMIKAFSEKAQIPYQQPQWCLVAKYF